MYRIESTLNTRLSYDSTFYSPTIRYHIASNLSLQKVPNYPVSISYPISKCQSTKITTNNCAINRIRNNTALNSSGHLSCYFFYFRFYVEDEPIEESIPLHPIHDHTTKDAPHEVTYQCVEGGTKRTKTKLADSDRHTYNVQLHRANATYWQCTVRPKGNHCRATVTQRVNEFQQGKQNHNHHPAAGAATAARVMASLKEKAVEDEFKPASAIVNELSLKKFDRICIEHEVTTNICRAVFRSF